MILQDNLYTIDNYVHNGNVVSCKIILNRDCPIYNMHFPDNPVTPGACTIQMSVELMQTCLNKSFYLKQIKNVKFLSVINPDEVTELLFKMSIQEMGDSEIKVCVDVVAKGDVFSKLSLLLSC